MSLSRLQVGFLLFFSQSDANPRSDWPGFAQERDDRIGLFCSPQRWRRGIGTNYQLLREEARIPEPVELSCAAPDGGQEVLDEGGMG